MGEFFYRPVGENFGLSPEIIDVVRAESISLFDVAPGSVIELDLSFDEDGGMLGKITMSIDQPANRTDWNRGSFTVKEADLSFESPIGEIVGRTGSLDSAIDYRPGTSHPISLGHVAHIDKGRSLIMNFDVPGKPDVVNRWIPFVLDFHLTPPH